MPLFETVGLKPTPAREAVLSALMDAGRPLSQPDLMACGEVASLDRVTVYRTLATLKAADLVHSIQGLDGVLRYCAHRPGSRCPGGHAHFLCQRCGAMSCLPDQPLPFVAVPVGAEVEGKQLLVYGICAACAERAR